MPGILLDGDLCRALLNELLVEEEVTWEGEGEGEGEGEERIEEGGGGGGG